MVIYEMILSALDEKYRGGGYTRFLQSCYADNFITAGAVEHLKPAIAHIEGLGPERGLFIQL